MIKVICDLLCAIIFTYCATTTDYEDSKRLCKISAFIWWVAFVVELIQIFRD